MNAITSGPDEATAPCRPDIAVKREAAAQVRLLMDEPRLRDCRHRAIRYLARE